MPPASTTFSTKVKISIILKISSLLLADLFIYLVVVLSGFCLGTAFLIEKEPGQRYRYKVGEYKSIEELNSMYNMS